MAVRITIPVEIPDTLEVQMLVTVQNGTNLDYSTNARLHEIPDTTRVITEDPVTGNVTRILHVNTGGTTVRMDMFEYTENYVIETRYGAGAPLVIRTEKATGRSIILDVPAGDAMTLEELRDTIRANPGQRIVPVGTEVSVPWTAEDGVEYENKLVLVDYANMVAQEDDSTGDTTWVGLLMSKYASLHELQFDAPEKKETTHTRSSYGYTYYGYYKQSSGGQMVDRYAHISALDTSGVEISQYKQSSGGQYAKIYHNKIRENGAYIVQYGYADWLASAVRQYLNSAAAAGEWWAEKHDGDMPPEDLASLRGYMAGFRSSDLAMFRTVKVKTKTKVPLDTDPTLEEEYETFWLPSEREVKSGTAAEDDEGVYWEDYWNSLGADASTTAANNARSVHRMDDPGQTCSVWLRTKNTNYTYQQGAISAAGVIVKTVHPDDKRRVTPICAVG